MTLLNKMKIGKSHLKILNEFYVIETLTKPLYFSGSDEATTFLL